MSTITIDLQARDHWQRFGRCWWRGYAWRGDDRFDPAELATLQWATPAEAATYCYALNGCFALIYQDEEVTAAAVDIIRSIPLLYQRDGRAVRDQLEPRNIIDLDRAWLSHNGWSRQEYLPGDRTVDRQIAALQAGELVWIDQQGPQIVNYYDHQRSEEVSKDYRLLSQQFLGVIERFCQRLIRYADKRPIVLLLSGGYDSRLLLAALHRAQYRRLHTVTYGLPGSPEARLAQRVTRQLGVAHEFVAYTPSLFARSWRPFGRYLRWAGHGISLPQEQDWFALWELRRLRRLEPESVIVPGYCGDLQAGSYVPDRYFSMPGRLSAPALGDWLIHRLTRWPVREGRQVLADVLPTSGQPNAAAAIAYLERWFIRERVSKYTVNGVRAYDDLGYDWYLPLWDREFVDFWQGIPYAYRQRMRLYRETLRDYLFAPLGIDFPEDVLTYTWRQRFRELVPAAWRSAWQADRFLPNENGLDALTERIATEVELPGLPLPVNAALGYYWQTFWNGQHI